MEHAQEITPEENKIYVDKTTNTSYTWNGTAFVAMSSAEVVKYTEQTLTDAQKTQARENIGVPVPDKKLIKIIRYDEQAYPMLQPIAYNAETGYFECESMPDWVEDNVMIVTKLNRYAALSNISEAVVQKDRDYATITVVDATHFTVSAITIPSDVDCSLFAFGIRQNWDTTGFSALPGDYFEIEFDDMTLSIGLYPGMLINGDSSKGGNAIILTAERGYVNNPVINSHGSVKIHLYGERSAKVISGTYNYTFKSGNNAVSAAELFNRRDIDTIQGYTTSTGKLYIRGGNSTPLLITPNSEIRVYKLNPALF